MTCDCKVLGGESCHMGDGCKAMETMAREALQQAGNHPAPCARSCEANAYEIEIRRLNAELERERMRLAACGVVAMADTPESAAKAREIRDEYRSASCDDVARRVDECMTLRAERDALAAKLKDAEHDRDEFRRVMNGFAEKMAELEGQEPVAWYADIEGWGREYNGCPELSNGVIGKPLYARPVPAESVNARLLDALKYAAGCLGTDGNDPIDLAITSAEAQQERLLQDMHDAGREIDRVMAEPAQRVVRLTAPDIVDALRGNGLYEDSRAFQRLFPILEADARAIESAVLRKNGIEVEE